MPEGDHHLAEERRLFYVGMTRAREAAPPQLGARLRLAHRATAESIPAGRRWTCRPQPRPICCGPARRSVWRGISERTERPPAAPTRPVSLADRQLRLSYGQISDYLDCPAPLSVRPRHSPADPRLAPDGLWPRPACRGAGLPPPAAGRPGDFARRAAGRAGCRLGVGGLPHPAARGGAPRGGSGGARLASGKSNRSTPPARLRWRRSSRVVMGRDRVRGRYDRVDIDADGRVVITDYKSAGRARSGHGGAPLARLAPALALRPRLRVTARTPARRADPAFPGLRHGRPQRADTEAPREGGPARWRR